MNEVTVRLLLCLAIAFSASALSAVPKPTGHDDQGLEDNILNSVDEELKKQDHQGEYSIDLVGSDGKSLNATRFIRGIPGQSAVSDFPHVFSIDGKALFSAGNKLEADVPTAGGIKIFCNATGDDAETISYNARCTANFPPGKYRIEPFGLEFAVGPSIEVSHPALSVSGKAISIHTTPVSFSAIDSVSGAEAPLRNFQLVFGSSDLLEHLAGPAAAPAFSALTLDLPVGVEYKSNLGRFRIDEKAKVTASDLAPGVTFNGGAFVQTVTGNLQPATEPFGKGYWVLSHNLRRVFKRGEAARFDVIESAGLQAADLPVVVHFDGHDRTIGRLSLPDSSAGADSRLFLLNTSAFAPGKYEISLQSPVAHPFAFEVVELLPTTPIVLFTINACGESPFRTDSAGFDQLRDTHVQFWSTYGFGGVLEAPKVEPARPYPAAPADAPPELRRSYSVGRALLDDSLRHGLTTIDFENRRLGWYNEGLAFHHTQPMSVERIVRRVQIFGQELEDYPAFAGMSYTWFPSLGGYAEGGVCTDPFFGTRMEILRQKVKEKTGFEPLTPEESTKLNAAGNSDDRVLADKFRNYWRAEQRMGFGDTFALYDRKLHEVRSDFIATTSENAGHDAAKSLTDMASAHDAMTFESYTDFGDWPMSAGFVADWGHAAAPGKPMWQAVESLQSEPAICAKEFYKFARGAEGIAVGVNDPSGARANRRRALTNRFLERYGPLVTDWSADTQVAVCASEVQFAEYDVHALHSHLTRLGYGPIIVSERTLEATGVPAGIKAVFIPNLKIPFNEKAEAVLKQFISKGGSVFLVGAQSQPIDGAKRINVAIKALWDVGGFAAHVAFFAEFKKVRPALEAALAEIGLSPRNGAGPEKAVILPSTSAGIRYVTVIASSLDAPDTQFVPASDVQVKVGDAKKIINLVTGEELTAANGAVHLDLVSEPVAFLALLETPPASIMLHHSPQLKAGQTLQLTAEIDWGKNVRGPIEYSISDAAGKKRATFYRLSGAKDAVSYNIPALDRAGAWSVVATDLLTGLIAKTTVKVSAADSIEAVVPTKDVYLPHPDRFPLFMSQPGPVRVVVEETQTSLRPDAERIVAALKKIGRDASVQLVTASSYDMHWLRWIPTHADERTLAQIDAGEIVGYRGDLKPYINTAKRAMVPEKGGWTDIAPPYVLRTDVVLFSGGRIADSLGVLSEWTASPDFPGRRRGVLEVSLSPFWANRDAISVVCHEDAGRKISVDRLIELIEAGGVGPPVPAFRSNETVATSAKVSGSERIKLEVPLKAFVPPALAESLSTSSDGWAVVRTKDAMAVISAAGEIRELPHSDLPPQIARDGTVLGGTQRIVKRHPAWNYPMSWTFSMLRSDPQGQAMSFDIPESLSPGDQFDGWDKGIVASPDGKSCFVGRDGGGFFLIDLLTGAYQFNDEPPRQVRFYEQVRAPLSVTAAQFSPDSGFVAYAVGNRPTGYGGMMGPPPGPFATATRLIDARSAKTVWLAEGKKFNDGGFSAVAGCLAVSDGGRRVALIDWDQEAVVFDEHGKESFRKPIFDWKARHAWNTNPKPLRCELSHDGSTALFASDGVVLVVARDGKTVAAVNVPALVDARLAPDGSSFYAADQDGLVIAYDSGGNERWRLQSEGEKPNLGIVDEAVVVADGAGELLIVDASGRVTRRTAFARIKPITARGQTLALSGPPIYRAPATLVVLQRLGAKPVAAWAPTGSPAKRFGRDFYGATEGINLQAGGADQRLIHLVYRISQNPAQVTLSGGPHPLTFTLDLPTPEYRVVDLPYEAGGEISLSVAPAAGLEVAELSVHVFAFPGSNGLYVRPAGSGNDHEDLATKKTPAPAEDPDLILDDKDATTAARAVRGKMKNAAIFSNNPDPDQVEGHYLRATGNPLDSFDGLKFTDGNPSAWTKGTIGQFGSRLLVDLNHLAHPKLCVTYARTLKQSEVMSGIAVLRGEKGDFALGEAAGPDRLAFEPRVVSSVIENDQFFNVFEMHGVDVAALGVYVISRDAKDMGLSEIELYE